MSVFEIIITISTALGLLTATMIVYTKLMVEITKLQVEQNNFRHELDAERQANLKSESYNREDHKEILKKIDELIQKKC